jgi:methyl-accepting chemotaxis protein
VRQRADPPLRRPAARCARPDLFTGRDTNGYAPAHNGAFSKTPSGDPAADLVNCRHKRIFNDPVGIKLARNQKSSLFQTYVRDTGEILNDLSMPITINGRHWGSVRIGFKTDLVK